jgi:hypothetical protein
MVSGVTNNLGDVAAEKFKIFLRGFLQIFLRLA